MKKIVILTGAGMSAESGISTFRGAGGLWNEYPIEQVATPEGFRRDPALVLEFYNMRRHELYNTNPNEGHRLIASLEDRYDVTIITQNIDNLHERAGSTNVIHLHGELTKGCSSINPDDTRYHKLLTTDAPDIHIGDKAGDGSQMRPFIVWFGEAVPKIEDAIHAIDGADIFIIIGTSLNVYPAAGLLNYVPYDVNVYLIDPNDVNVNTAHRVTVLKMGASDGMREIIEKYLP